MKSKYLVGLLAGLLVLLAACGLTSPKSESGAMPSTTENERSTLDKEVQTQEEAIVKDTLAEKGAMAENTAESVAGDGPMEKDTVTDDMQVVNSGPTQAQLRILNSLPNNGPAPELLNDVFLNSDFLRLADLRGQVVIIEFWTYG